MFGQLSPILSGLTLTNLLTFPTHRQAGASALSRHRLMKTTFRLPKRTSKIHRPLMPGSIGTAAKLLDTGPTT
ncbi:hypothetical protein [Streptomyces sp. NPDC041003]|uniref:hypothetical protein n=1 Tax=Streptomyces sp. NPDC041003 TaxID=3155730 RepID=UPI0033D7990C